MTEASMFEVTVRGICSLRPPSSDCQVRQMAKICVLMPVALQQWPGQSETDTDSKDAPKRLNIPAAILL